MAQLSTGNMLTNHRRTTMWKKDADTSLFLAFRYALGRQSYITGMVAELLIKYSHLLSDRSKQLIKKEIAQAIEEGTAGMDCDVEEWKYVAIKLGGEVE